MYVCIYVCMHVCIYDMYVCMDVCMCVLFMYICVYVCTYVCMYVCMYNDSSTRICIIMFITNTDCHLHTILADLYFGTFTSLESPSKNVEMSDKRPYQAAFSQALPATRRVTSALPPLNSSRPPVEEMHTWTSPNQTLLFDKAKGNENLKTFHIPVCLPPVAEGFRGFIYNVKGNLGIQGARPPFNLVGMVIEVTVGPFKCKNPNAMPHLEGADFELPTTMAKPIYALVEDASGRVHAIALSLIQLQTLIRGMGQTDMAFSLAGFPPKIGRRFTPAREQALVMGIQRYSPGYCPLGTAPIFRVGWASAAARFGDQQTAPQFFDLISTSLLTAAPGYWLTYKLMNCIQMPHLRDDRARHEAINKLYKDCNANEIHFGPPYNHCQVEYRDFNMRGRFGFNSSPNPYDGLDED